MFQIIYSFFTYLGRKEKKTVEQKNSRVWNLVLEYEKKCRIQITFVTLIYFFHFQKKE